MKRIMIKVAALAVTFLFFYASNAKAENDFNLNSLSASEIKKASLTGLNPVIPTMKKKSKKNGP
jgi:hypothetical protein